MPGKADTLGHKEISPELREVVGKVQFENGDSKKKSPSPANLLDHLQLELELFVFELQLIALIS